jgi:hypothetical protein
VLCQEIVLKQTAQGLQQGSRLLSETRQSGADIEDFSTL